MSDYLTDAADLLAEPDPGLTPWLLEGHIVDQALTAVARRWKTTKSWAMLEAAVSIATGTPAFGAVAVPEAGPVVYVIEESGKRALWRRLDALCRGRAMRPDELRGRLRSRRTSASSWTASSGKRPSLRPASPSGRARSSSTRSRA
jgi:RecA-family ATPase